MVAVILSYAMGLPALALDQAELDQGQGPAGNGTQEEIDADINKYASCRKREFATNGNAIDADFNEAQLSVIVQIQGDLESKWQKKIGTNASDPWYDPDVTYVREVRASAADATSAWMKLPGLVNLGGGDFRKVPDADAYRLLMTTCGILVFKRAGNFCEQRSAPVRYRSSDPKDLESVGWIDERQGDHPYTLLAMYPSTFTPNAIADDIANLREMEADNAALIGGEFVLFVGELFPFMGVWRTVLEKGIYKYQKFDAVSDSLGISTDILLDAIPFATQSKKFAKASKYLWALAAAGAAARASLQTYRNGRPQVVDLARLVILGLVFHDLGVKTAANPNAFAEEVIRESGLKSSASELPGAAASLASKVDPTIALKISKAIDPMNPSSLDDVVRLFRIDGDKAGYFQRLADWESLAKKIETSTDSTIDTIRALGIAGQDGTRIWNGIPIHIDADAAIEYGPSAITALKKQIADTLESSKGDPTVTIELVTDYMATEKVYSAMAVLGGPYPKRRWMYFDAETGRAYLSDIRIKKDGVARRLDLADPVERAMDAAHKRMVLEELLHGLGHRFPGKGFKYVDKIDGQERIGHYLPQTTELVRFEAWLSKQSGEYLRAAFSPNQSADPGEWKQNMLSKLMEADIFFMFKKQNIEPGAYYTIPYQIREAAERWLKAGMPESGTLPEI